MRNSGEIQSHQFLIHIERERREEGAEDIATLMQSTSAESELWPGIRLHTSHLHIPVTRPLKTHTHILALIDHNVIILRIYSPRI